MEEGVSVFHSALESTFFSWMFSLGLFEDEIFCKMIIFTFISFCKGAEEVSGSFSLGMTSKLPDN